MIISQSMVKSFRRCQREFYYKNVEHLVPKRPKPPLIYGTIVHEILEFHLTGGKRWQGILEQYRTTMKNLFEVERETYGDMLENIERTMTSYFQWYSKEPLKPVKIGGQATEVKLQAKLSKYITMEGKLDFIGKSEDGRVWLVDHKTCRDLPRDDLRYSDIQSAVYTVLLQRAGVEVDGVCWNYIRKKPPAEPALLKNGQLSRAAIDTTWFWYREAIIKHGLNQKDYLDVKEKLEGKEDDFFMRHYMPINENILENLIGEFEETGMRICAAIDGEHTWIRTIDRHCNWCSYYKLCQAELRGLDSDFMRKADYKVDEDFEGEVNEVE